MKTSEASPHTNERLTSFVASKLGRLVSWVDDCLLYDSETNRLGLPPTVLNSIARRSPDVYGLLLTIADRVSPRSPAEEDLQIWRPTLFSLATILHWFSQDQLSAVRLAHDALSDDVFPTSAQAALERATECKFVADLPEPPILEHFTKPDSGPLHLWTWDKVYRSPDDPDPSKFETLRRARLSKVLELRYNREILLYAQRHYLAAQSAVCDSAGRDQSKGSTRGWEFDYILPSGLVGDKKGCRFQKFVKQWHETIGNLRAIACQDDRSDLSSPACQKIATAQDMADSFVLPGEVAAFSGREVLGDEAEATAFADAARMRMTRIYSEWFAALSPETWQRQSVCTTISDPNR